MTADARRRVARRAATARWIRDRFGASSFRDLDLPGGDVVDTGLSDLLDAKESVESLLVSLAAARLRRELVPLGRTLADPETRLYHLLAARHGDLAHARYNALRREIVSFADACRLVRMRRKRAS